MMSSLPDPCDHSKYHTNILFFSNLASQLTKAQPITFNHESFLSLKRERTNFVICYRKTGIKLEREKKEEEKPSHKTGTLFQFCVQCSNWKHFLFVSNINKYNCINHPFMNLAWWICREMKLNH